jgi:hypothetical protein
MIDLGDCTHHVSCNEVDQYEIDKETEAWGRIHAPIVDAS